MNIINNNINYIRNENGNFSGFYYIKKEELAKMSYNEKFFPPCKCGKKPEFRWKEVGMTGKEGLLYGITPFRGRNNEELCCKCADFCWQCGQKGLSGEGHTKYEETWDNPCREWAVRYCQKCYWERNKEEKKDGLIYCSHCGKLSELECGSTQSGKNYCSNDCYEASEPNVKVKSDEQNQAPNLTDKPPTSAESFIFDANTGEIKSQKNDNSDKNKDVVQPVKVIVDKGESSENNSPPNCQEAPPNCQATPPNQENNKEMLVIDLRFIKKIELTADGKLMIEFNGSENSNYTLSQTITAEQVNSSQELQTIKNYCEKSGKSSLSQSELNDIFKAHNTSGSTDKPNDNNKSLTVGLSIAAALMVGLVIGLFLKKRKGVKRS